MTTPHQPPNGAGLRAPGRLSRALIALAGTPDDASDVDARLIMINRLAAETLAAVAFASVTATRRGAPTTVAATSELALAVDQAQYDEQTGPCLDALDRGTPLPVNDIATTMTWPRFREAALRMGLRASVSVPLFAGSGVTIAALNLYGHDPRTMAPLGSLVLAAYDPDRTPRTHSPDGGAPDLLTGLAGAFTVRGQIQRAVGVVMASRHCSPAEAYLFLRAQAADTWTDLADVAAGVLERASRPADHRP